MTRKQPYSNKTDGSLIFISYRRSESQAMTDRLYERLCHKFGKEQVFMDIGNIPAGALFPDLIHERLESSRTLIVVIDKSWLTTLANRAEDPRDFVRIELETAHKLGLHIIPVWVGDIGELNTSQLPPSLEPLRFQDLTAIPLRSGRDFEHDVKALTDRLCRDHKPRRHVFYRRLALATTTIGLIISLLVYLNNGPSVKYLKTQTEVSEESQNASGVQLPHYRTRLPPNQGALLIRSDTPKVLARAYSSKDLSSRVLAANEEHPVLSGTYLLKVKAPDHKTYHEWKMVINGRSTIVKANLVGQDKSLLKENLESSSKLTDVFKFNSTLPLTPLLHPEGHSGRSSLNFVPGGNMQVSGNQSISSAQVIPVIDTALFTSVELRFWYLSRSNPRLNNEHNCDSSLDLYYRLDNNQRWIHKMSHCGDHITESKGWRESIQKFDVNTNKSIEFKLIYKLQNYTNKNPEQVFLIDDMEILGAEEFDPPERFIIADYNFLDTGTDSTGRSDAMKTTNTPISNGSMFLNGVYRKEEGYTALAHLDLLHYPSFTIRVIFNPIKFEYHLAVEDGERRENIITCGQYFRWLSYSYRDRKLRLSLNNGQIVHEFEDSQISEGVSHDLTFSFDLFNYRVYTMLDGRSLGPVILDPDFFLNAMESERSTDDKVITFVNSSTGGVFYGYIDRLQVFDRAFSKAELEHFWGMPSDE